MRRRERERVREMKRKTEREIDKRNRVLRSLSHKDGRMDEWMEGLKEGRRDDTKMQVK